MKWLPLLFLFAGCASVPETLSTDKFYKRDLKITVNGKTADGVLVADSKSQYEIAIEAPGDLDLLTISTCHREITSEDAGGGWWWSGNKGKIKYWPMAKVEEEGGCPLRISALEKDNGQNSWAFIDFKDSKMEMIPQVLCNGQSIVEKGVAVCQAHEGLIQEINFPEPTKFSDKAACDFQFQTTDEKHYKFTQPAKECVVLFKGKDSGQMFRLVTLGYEAILIRKN